MGTGTKVLAGAWMAKSVFWLGIVLPALLSMVPYLLTAAKQASGDVLWEEELVGLDMAVFVAAADGMLC